MEKKSILGRLCNCSIDSKEIDRLFLTVLTGGKTSTRSFKKMIPINYISIIHMQSEITQKTDSKIEIGE